MDTKNVSNKVLRQGAPQPPVFKPGTWSPAVRTSLTSSSNDTDHTPAIQRFSDDKTLPRQTQDKQ